MLQLVFMMSWQQLMMRLSIIRSVPTPQHVKTEEVKMPQLDMRISSWCIRECADA